MLKLASLLALLFCLLPKATASTGEDLDSITRQIYSQTGLSEQQVPYNHFEAGYRRYLQGLRSNEFRSPLITFVNFGIHSAQDRLFLVDVSTGGARLVFQTNVSHGQNSGTPQHATRFSNVDGSLQSSLGFFKVSEEYSGNHGRSIRIDGLSGELNSLARDRLVVFHSANYASQNWVSSNGYTGRSWGCFVVSYAVRDSYFDQIVNGTLLYSFYRDQGANASGDTSDLAELARNNTEGSGANVTPGDPAPVLSDNPRFANANPSMAAQGQAGDHMSLAAGTGVEGAGSLDYDGNGEPDGFEQDDPQINSDGDTPYRGNNAFERCQSMADRPWSEVVRLTNEGQDPHQFFRGSWLDLERKSVTTDNITPSAGAAAAQNHLGVVNECAAMAMTADPQNYTRVDPNAQAVVRSQDGSIECHYRGAEAVDFTQCQQLVAAHDQLTLAEANLHRDQGEAFKAQGQQAVDGLKTGINIQGNSAVLASTLTASAANSAAEREQFQAARIDAMAVELAAMPNYKSLLAKCHSRSSQYPKGALLDYQAFIATIPEIKIPMSPPLGDACARALGRLDVKYIQNKKAKDQAKVVLEKLGYKIEKLQDQQSKLLLQQQGFNDTGMKGASIPDYKLKDLEKAEQGAFGVIDMDLKLSSGKGPIGPKRRPAAKTSFSYPDFNPSMGQKNRSQGIKQGLIAPYQQDYREQLRANTKGFFSLVKEGYSKKLINFMKANGLTLSDIDYAFSQGIISAAQAKALKEKLKDRLGKIVSRRQVDYELEANSRGQGNQSWQIEKDSNKSLFDIIHHRYLKQPQLTQ